ncbi:MAG: response regulator transcription factor [bacterium]|nr:response regulator transcription factor [bacterium]
MSDRNDLPDNAPHILVVDDDERIRDLLAKYLMGNGYRVTKARDAIAARSALSGLEFDLLILDVMMPGETGFELAQSIKDEINAPIFMLTALGEPEQRVKGLEIGVDDYISKPFEPRELLIRISNILRRIEKSSVSNDDINIGEFQFNIARGDLKSNSETIKLTERERELLRIFARRRGETVGRHELSGGDGDSSDRAVDVQINRLRRKIEKDPGNPVYLQTIRGKGYILHTDE